MNDGDKESVETFTASLNTTDSDVNIVDGNGTITIIDDDGRLFYKIEVIPIGLICFIMQVRFIGVWVVSLVIQKIFNTKELGGREAEGVEPQLFEEEGRAPQSRGKNFDNYT